MDKIKQALRVISVGKYPTTLYTDQGRPSKSSALGGLVTIIFGLVVGAIMISFLVATFNKEHQNIEIITKKINAYQVDSVP